MSDLVEEVPVEVVSDTSSESSVEMVKIGTEDVPLEGVVDLNSVFGCCPVCGAGISIDLSAIKDEE